VSGAPARKLKANSSVLSCVPARQSKIVRCLAIEALRPIRGEWFGRLQIIEHGLFDGLGDNVTMAVAGMVTGQLIERVGPVRRGLQAQLNLLNEIMAYAYGHHLWIVDGGPIAALENKKVK